MTDKVKHIVFSRYLRKATERFDLDKYSKKLDEMTEEDRLREFQKLKKELQECKAEMNAIAVEHPDPDMRQYAKEINELYDSIVLDGELDINAIKILELAEEKTKKFGKGNVGMLNSKGKFVCLYCLQDEEAVRNFIKLYDLKTIITVYDVSRLKAGSFYQCENCNRKISLNGITD